LEIRWRRRSSRRAAIRSLSSFLAGSPLLRSQLDPLRDHSRVPGLDELTTALDFESVAFAKLPRAAYNYTAYGSEGEFTLRRNREAFGWVSLVPRVAAVAPGSVQTSLDLFGMKLASPVMISPSAAQLAIHPEGEAAMYRGATMAANTPMIVSNVASLPLPKIAEAATGPLWFQLYPKREPDANRAAMDDALNAGCRAIVVTVDQQAAVFERALHDRNLGRAGGPQRRTRSAPANPYRVDETRIWYHWGMFDQIRKAVKAPLIVKGILTAGDAILAIEHGADGLYVSNHGGRALDYSPSTIEVLPEIAAAVRGRVPILLDSGIRRGEDILEALALGATAVCLGRVPRWGLAAYGSSGVQRVLHILQRELVAAMAATGAASLASIDSSLVRTDFA
jgi:isopentenyl diphosphate isomerase/L-lactate dehydrogenase-like FMN-dependent dehydrogenase